ncbi:MAG: DUF427 domain-containing protein [Rhodospirillales bacterium]
MTTSNGSQRANPGPGYRERPDHRVTVEDHPGRHRVLFNGEVVADSERTLLITETGHGRVHYFPRADVRMDLMRQSRRHTRCPFKGEASYWHLEAGGEMAADAVWAYPDPYDEVAAIRDFVAFDMAKMDELRFGN